MIPKQDRQGVRTARDIEQKYNLNTDFSAIEKQVANANRTAQNAQSAADNAATMAEELSDDVGELAQSVGIHSENIMNLDERVTELEESGGLSDEVMAEIVNEVIAKLPTYNGEVEDV